MRLFARLGMLVTLVALSVNFGCAKEKEATTTQIANGEAAQNVSGMAKETLLALKFHHDS